MKRRQFLQTVMDATATLSWLSESVVAAGTATQPRAVPIDAMEADPAKDWLARWERGILGDSRNRYCDREMGEEIGWLISPFLNGFYYGYQATQDARWIERLIDWAESWIRRGVKEPDGSVGWPKGGTGGAVSQDFYTDSLLGEAMALRPVVLMADEILRDPGLKTRFGPQAEGFLRLGGQVFEKWDSRGCWREVKEGGLWVVPAFGVDQQTGQWTEGYERRNTEGFSNPANKQNHIARWLLAMHHATEQPVYRERAEKWWRLMKSRIRTREGGEYAVWNYWDPAGPWDFKSDGSPRHWVGVHPNGGYYQIDVEGIVAAFEHGLVFGRGDIDRLIATNRDFMWNQQVAGPRFRRIDGGEPDSRWKDSPGLLWTSLVPYDPMLRKVLVANHDPGSWAGLAATPWFVAREASGKPIP